LQIFYDFSCIYQKKAVFLQRFLELRVKKKAMRHTKPHRLQRFALICAFAMCCVSLSAAGENLLSNSSFEQYTCNVFGCSFEDWSLPLGTASPNTNDKLDGEVSLQMTPPFASVLDNAVWLSDDYYVPGTPFRILIQYKVLALPQDEALELDCYWEAGAGGNADEINAHDADRLRGVFARAVSVDWQSLEFVTTKPAFSSYLRIRIKVPEGADVLFDAFEVEKAGKAPDEPYIEVSPVRLSSVSTTLGETVDFETVHIEQGNVTGVTTFDLRGYNPEMFRLSATSLSAEESEIDLIITYAPTQAGTHTAVLTIDNLSHTTLFQSLSLTGVCTDPEKEPTITVTPSVLPVFEVLAGQSTTGTFSVTSENCSDYVYLRVDHVKGTAFTIDGSMMGKNTTTTFTVRFAPQEPGEYQSTVTIYSEGVETQVLTLNGNGIKPDEDNIDWQTHFVWDESQPLKLMNETFDNINHNKTLVLEGWQNVAAAEDRPWWGFDEDKTSPKRGTERYAKATAYQYGKDSTDTWDMFLVTPALDYKNAERKVFVFSIMGEYMPDEESPTRLEIFYVDALLGEKAYFQDLTESFAFPKTSEENNTWRTYFLDLEPFAETMADVFHIAFRYVGPNGGQGVVTYYIDNVSWGRTDLPEIEVSPEYVIDSTMTPDEQKVLAEINVEGRNLTGEIQLAIGGSNYKNFELSSSSLPAAGGSFIITFEGAQEGVYEAYVLLGSKGAPDVILPIAVRCSKTTGVEDVESEKLKVESVKLLREGQIVIKRGEREHTVLGTQIK